MKVFAWCLPEVDRGEGGAKDGEQLGWAEFGTEERVGQENFDRVQHLDLDDRARVPHVVAQLAEDQSGRVHVDCSYAYLTAGIAASLGYGWTILLSSYFERI